MPHVWNRSGRKLLQVPCSKRAGFGRSRVCQSEVVKDTSHGWRHRFKTSGIDQGVEMRVLDAIQAHGQRNVSEGYGDVTIKAQANAIATFPSTDIALR